ncbi:hypothetical protein CNG00870 [Cryptococcus deneoformans JEC21]|uniref:Uncharacterized protein n=2 Tax=Cryptococcus deneoformans TaxID=40410 RepID=A0A0S2M5H9_CRYD1|nr:hypothetical protein CNG00870 [Cryptococcus neoformans var. neoformans JEC21]ALO69263.1 hypothetical protein CNG00870 [Cryptococcus neoformans var. neoformans JEC21]
MFTPLSKGSEHVQDTLWDNSSPRKTRIRPLVSSVLKSNAGSGSGSNTVSHTDHGPSVRPGPSLTGTDNRTDNRNRTGNRKRTGDGEGNHHGKTQGTSLPARSSWLAPVPRSAGRSRQCKAVAAGVDDGDGDGNGDGDGLVVIAGGKGMEGEGEGEGENGSRNGIRRGTTLSPGRRRRRSFSNRGASRTGAGTEMEDEKETLLSLFFQPRRERVEGWMDSFWKRHAVLVIVPCLIVWIWLAVPFPVSDPYKDDPFPEIPSWPKRPKNEDGDGGNSSTMNPGERGEGEEGDGTSLPLDVNFYFFLFWYFGMYIAVALFFITNLFSLYRLNWWPSRLGGKLSYTLSWSLTLLIGLLTHHLDLFYLRKRWKGRDPGDDDVEWERKTFWVVLSFVAMLMPAVACFSKLKRDKRHTYRHPLPAVYQTFFGQAFSRRFPASWVRFLWFMTSLAIASFSLIVGQAYASLFLTTLPHTSLDAGTWVWSWVITVQLLAQASFFILGAKVRSRALLFIYRLFFQLVYHVFYRNLFARLRSPTQFATVQLLSSISTILIFPIQMSRPWHRLLQIIIGYPNPWEEHVENVAMGFYCRGLAQNVTMVGFLGWLSILHFGPNSQLYPFFRFHPTPEDPYTFPMTFIASCVIWSSELVSSFIARQIMSYAFGVNVSQIGIDEMKDYPELVPACGWASVHVSMNILLFLIKLNFR